MPSQYAAAGHQQSAFSRHCMGTAIGERYRETCSVQLEVSLVVVFRELRTFGHSQLLAFAFVFSCELLQTLKTPKA